MSSAIRIGSLLLGWTWMVQLAGAWEPPSPDTLLAAYFEDEVAALEAACLAEIDSKEAWLAQRERYRAELLEMLTLDPFPEKTPLNARVTGHVDHEGDGDAFTVENVVFESLPQCYVTGNLYLPADTSAPSPTVLYVSGHGPVKEDGVSYGNKVAYQRHGAWFARHGYVCLVLDTVQLGEIEGIHHGTYRYGMWWWNARGYSSAGIEAWNSVRALDYLQTRPEVDPKRFGVTGRSGGGAYSWWLAAIDERVRVAVPVAGITSLRNHVVDGCVEGHCDCMYPVNTYRWDFPAVAALVAPRPLLISNTDKDSIFPLEGVLDVHAKTRSIYALLDAEAHLGLQIAEGPHKDTQDLRVHAFTWFERFLKGADPPPLIRKPAEAFLTPQQLKVLDTIPEDERTSTIHESFAHQAPAPDVPTDEVTWRRARDGWMTALREKVFRGWPKDARVPEPILRQEITKEVHTFRVYDFESHSNGRLPLLVVSPRETTVLSVQVTVLDDDAWQAWMARALAVDEALVRPFAPESASWPERDPAGAAAWFAREGVAHVYLAARGIGPSAWSGDARVQVHLRRRFMLLGQTVDGMRVFDLCQGMRAASSLFPHVEGGWSLMADGTMGVNALYASLFLTEMPFALSLTRLPASHREGPDYLNVMRFLDLPTALAMAKEWRAVRVGESPESLSSFGSLVEARLGWKH